MRELSLLSDGGHLARMVSLRVSRFTFYVWIRCEPTELLYIIDEQEHNQSCVCVRACVLCVRVCCACVRARILYFCSKQAMGSFCFPCIFFLRLCLRVCLMSASSSIGHSTLQMAIGPPQLYRCIWSLPDLFRCH